MCIAAGGDYFEGGLEFHVCTINKSAHTKKVLEIYLMNEPCIYIYIYNDIMDTHLWPLISCRLFTTIIRQKRKDFEEIEKCC